MVKLKASRREITLCARDGIAPSRAVTDKCDAALAQCKPAMAFADHGPRAAKAHDERSAQTRDSQCYGALHQPGRYKPNKEGKARPKAFLPTFMFMVCSELYFDASRLV